MRALPKAQGAIDWLNKVINETITGAALVRLLDAHRDEDAKFVAANTEARDISLKILRLFAWLIPIIMFCTNVATLLILVLGGRFVISGAMSLGDFTAFNSYLSILIFPVIMIGFMSNVIAQSTASYGRISGVLAAPPPAARGTVTAPIRGDITVSHITVKAGERETLRTSAAGGGRHEAAVIGPTARASRSLYYWRACSAGVRHGPCGRNLNEHDNRRSTGRSRSSPDATLFNRRSARTSVSAGRRRTPIWQRRSRRRAFASAPAAGVTLSSPTREPPGGQKQRIMLARALALNPRVLLLDDFTARVDATTERKILENVRTNYAGVTLVSVTQKIAPVQDYDQIVLMMEGEVLAAGTHEELLDTCPEYAQIHESQRSTSHYEPVQA